jgi:hypothetical protein
MALEPIEARQARVKQLAEHQKGNEAAIREQEEAQASLAERAAVPLGERSGVTMRKAAPGPTENKSLSGPAENKGATDALSGVAFASDAAYDAARDAGLTADSFKGKRKSGASGFTVGDVRKLAEQG